MDYPPLRWQRVLLYTLILLAGAAVCLVVMPAPKQKFILTQSFTVVTLASAIWWIVQSRRHIQLKRERRVWTCVVVGLAFAVLGRLLQLAFAPAQQPVVSHSPSDLPFLLCYAALWTALLLRSGKYPADRLAKSLIWCDLTIILWASCMLAYHLVPHVLISTGRSEWPANIVYGYAAVAVITLLMVSLMLFRAVVRSFQRPRGVLVLGILSLLAGDIATRFATGVWLAVLVSLFGMAGILCIGISARWEASLYEQRLQRSRVIDPFPSIVGLLIPALLVILALITSLWDIIVNAPAPTIISLQVTLIHLATLVLLVTLRQMLTFENHRRLYRSLQSLYSEMAQHAATDPLTNCANHRYFMERLQKEVRRAVRYQRPLALIFCDLDHFKRVNDSYGHVAGDRTLCAMANCLREGVRDTDLVARYGGEEFVVLLPETTLRQAERLAERLRQSIEDLIISHRQQTVIRVTMSCGVSAYPETSMSLDSLLASADHAMYTAKAEGRNRVIAATLQASV